MTRKADAVEGHIRKGDDDGQAQDCAASTTFAGRLASESVTRRPQKDRTASPAGRVSDHVERKLPVVAVGHSSADGPSSGGRVCASTVAAASTGSSTGNTSGQCHQHVSPMVSKNPTTCRVIAPPGGASARARGRASETSCKDDFGRERPRLARGDGWDTAWYTTWYTPHNAEPRQRRKRGRSRLVPLRWRGSGTSV